MGNDQEGGVASRHIQFVQGLEGTLGELFRAAVQVTGLDLTSKVSDVRVGLG